MLVLKPGEPDPTDIDSESSRSSSAGSRPGSASRIQRVVPTIKRKTNDESDEPFMKEIDDLNISPSKSSIKHIEEVSVDDKMTVEMDTDIPSTYAPVELVTEFLACVMTRDFIQAKSLCQKILDIEPGNETCKEFSNVLNVALAQENNKMSDNDDVGDEDSDSDDDSELSSDDDSSISDTSGDDSGLSEDDDKESVSGEESGESEDEELTIEDVNKLNLLMGGMKIVKDT